MLPIVVAYIPYLGMIGLHRSAAWAATSLRAARGSNPVTVNTIDESYSMFVNVHRLGGGPMHSAFRSNAVDAESCLRKNAARKRSVFIGSERAGCSRKTVYEIKFGSIVLLVL